MVTNVVYPYKIMSSCDAILAKVHTKEHQTTITSLKHIFGKQLREILFPIKGSPLKVWSYSEFANDHYLALCPIRHGQPNLQKMITQPSVSFRERE